jgi:ELWxxDGT repeat protein
MQMGSWTFRPAFAVSTLLVFTGLDPAAGRQPFISDLTPEGTHLLAVIEPLALPLPR